MKNRLRHIVRTTNWWMNGLLVLLIVVVFLIIKVYFPSIKQARNILEDAHQKERLNSVYSDSTTLIFAIDIFQSPICKLLYQKDLSQAYYYLGRYYDLCTMQYKEAARCYARGDYYMVETQRYSAALYSHIEALCELAGETEASIYYKEKATEAVAKGAEALTNSTLNSLIMRDIQPDHEVDLAIAARILSDHRETQQIRILGRFGLGSFVSVVFLLLILFYAFYQTFSTQLQVQSEQLQEKEGALQDMAQSVYATRRQEWTYHIEAFRAEHPEPSKAWHDYGVLKQAANPALLFLPDLLEKEYHLAEREITFCILHLLYPERTMPELAEYMHYAPSAIRSYKQRIAKKVGVSSAELANRLMEIAVVQGRK